MSSPTPNTGIIANMAPRRRKEINRPLPDYMRLRDGYYSWRHPETKIEYGLGSDRKKAIKEAIRANASLASRERSLVDRINAESGKSWGEWLKTYEPILLTGKGDKELAPNTLKAYRRELRLAASLFDQSTAASAITTADIIAEIDKLTAAGKMNTAHGIRAHLHESFRHMVMRDWRKDNPVEAIDRIKVRVKRARLSFDVFMKIYEAETTVWAKNAYALALVSSQAREECVSALFKDFHDGAWWCDRQKSGARIILPLELRLDCFGLSLGDVYKQCRGTGVLSKHLIHQTKTRYRSPAGAPIAADTISSHFTATLESLQLDWGGKDPPTFHEIRSLSGRLYKQEGRVNPQELYGHADEKTTEIYLDDRSGKREWLKVGIKK
jgi:hypothetical protein